MSMLPPDPVYIFKGEMNSVSCVAFRIMPTSECIYAGTQSGIVHVWDLKNKRESGKFTIGEESCLSIIIHQDLIITNDKTGNISFWNEDNNKWTLEKQIKTDFFGFCKSCAFQGILYTSIKDSKCQTISIKSRETLKLLSLHDDNKLGEIMSLWVNTINDRKYIIIAYEANRLILWDLETEKKVSELELEGCPMCVDFHPVTNKGICGDPSDKVLIFSLTKNLEFKVLKSVKLTNMGVASVKIRPDGKLVAVGCWDGKLRLYSWKTLVLLAVLDTHSSTVQDVCFTEEYKEEGKSKYLLAAGSQDCMVSLWDLYN